MMFRGQGARKPLLPSIARIPRLRRVLSGYDDWQGFQLDVVARFAKYARPFIQPAPVDYEEWLVHAQHYGAPTRLLDWSTNPLKALFWAVENAGEDSTNGVVWALEPSYWRDDPFAPTPLDNDGLTPYLPKHLNARLIAQESCFVAFPLPPNRKALQPLDEPHAYSKDVAELASVTIPRNAKRWLRIELHTLGITHRLVLGDLVGIGATVRAELL
jgi:hypothetical protein